MLVSTQLQCYRTRPGVPIQAQHEPKQQVAQVTTCNRLGAPRCCPIQPSLRRIRCCNTNYGVSSRKRMTIITCASIRSSPPLVVDRMAVKTFLLNQFVPIGLIVAILVGYVQNDCTISVDHDQSQSRTTTTAPLHHTLAHMQPSMASCG